MNYKVGDIIIRIKNAVLARRRKVMFASSKLTKNILSVLVKEGYLKTISEKEVEGQKMLVAEVAHDKKMAVFTDVKIISKPSLRVYATAKKLETVVKRGMGTVVLSTNSGLMTGKEALKKGLGGELLFEIW